VVVTTFLGLSCKRSCRKAPYNGYPGLCPVSLCASFP
jgi:hypothetical protein